MIEVADIFRLHWDEYQSQRTVLPSQRQAVAALLRCRTPACGGHVYQCDQCGHQTYSYHSCKHRACPKCHGQQTRDWLDKQQERWLGSGYYLLTFTLPDACRSLAWSHPREIYSLLLSTAAAALQKLAWDPRYLGAQVAVLAVLHTWTRALLYHPHVHLLVSAGGLSQDGQHWVAPPNPAFLVPGYALSKIFRGKFRAGLRQRGLLAEVPAWVWEQDWVVHCRHAGSGAKALEYLGRYVFRTAIANSRLERFENGQVTFCYRDNRTQQVCHPTLAALEFMRRFLAHILPKGCVKVRSYGLWSSRCAPKLRQAQKLLSAPAIPEDRSRPRAEPPSAARGLAPVCPQCKNGHLQLLRRILPERARPP